MKFKLSDEAKKRSETNKANAALKKYHKLRVQVATRLTGLSGRKLRRN